MPHCKGNTKYLNASIRGSDRATSGARRLFGSQHCMSRRRTTIARGLAPSRAVPRTTLSTGCVSTLAANGAIE